MQIYPNQQPNIGANSLDLLFTGSNSLDVKNIEILYKSRTNMLDVLRNFNLNLNLLGLSDGEYINFNSFIVEGLAQNERAKFTLILDNESFELQDENSVIIFSGNAAQKYSDKNIKFEIKNHNFKERKEVFIEYSRVEDYVQSFSEKFVIEAFESRTGFYSNGGLISVSYSAIDTENARKILDFSNNLFIENNIKSESEKARKAIEFIDQRIVSVETILNANKDKLKVFKESNNSLNVELEVQSIIESINLLEEKLSTLELEIAKAENNYTSSNPVYLDLLNQKNVLLQQKKNIEEEIKQLPLAQQEYIDLFREVEIAQLLYSELSNKKLEYSILEASTLGNMRIVDTAYVSEKLSPSLSLIFIFSILLSFLSILFAIFRGLFLIPISNPAELSDNNINLPICGVVPEVDFADNELESIDDERFKQSVESTVINLSQIEKSHKKDGLASVLLFTSATPANGKSFISYFLARRLSEIGKKVLLIDADLKRGSQHKKFDTKPIRQSEFLSINTDNMQKYKSSDGIYFIPRVSKTSSSFQFLYSTEFNNQIEKFKEAFDYIIFDTPPILSVSDTSILMTYSDLNFSIIRHGLTKINEIKQMIAINKQIGIDFNGVIYNAYKKPASYYGYYGIYGNYAYQYYAKRYLDYSYDYKDNEDK